MIQTQKKIIQTYYFVVKGLVDEKGRNEVESALIRIVGVLSFSINITESKVIVRSQASSNIVSSAIRSTGYTNVTLLNDNKENEPEYLPEENSASTNGSWLSSLVSFGDKDEKRKKNPNNGWFGWGLRSVAETLNIL